MTCPQDNIEHSHEGVRLLEISKKSFWVWLNMLLMILYNSHLKIPPNMLLNRSILFACYLTKENYKSPISKVGILANECMPRWKNAFWDIFWFSSYLYIQNWHQDWHESMHSIITCWGTANVLCKGVFPIPIASAITSFHSNVEFHTNKCPTKCW